MYSQTGLLGIDMNSSGMGLYIALSIAVALAAYFIGNISPSTIISRAHGIDIRKEGSGNPGTTNTLRVLGKKAALAVLVVDILKGTVAVVLAGLLLGNGAASTAAVCAFLGHVFPATQKFKGGKGVATAFGTLLGINPLMALCCLAVAALFVLITKRMSVGSIIAAVSCPVFAFFMAKGFFVEGIIMAAVIVIKHRSNIVRLLHGEEPKLSFKK